MAPGQFAPPADGAPTGSPYPYGYPCSPSMPLSSYPGAPSAPLSSYPGAPSIPSAPYATPTLPGQMAPGWPAPAQLPPLAPRPARRRLWIALGSIGAAVLIVVVGVLLALFTYLAPGSVASTLCQDLQTQAYGDAYSILSIQLRGQLSGTQFSQDMQALDSGDGKVLSCLASTPGNGYSYSFGGTATVSAAIQRETSGTLTGQIHLRHESAGWKVAGVDTSLLGVNFDVLRVSAAFCEALRTQNYVAAYAQLGSGQQEASLADFTTAMRQHDTIDGTVSACGLTQVSPGADDNAASVTVGITRGKLGARTGNLNLQVEDNQWKIDTIASAVLGTDLGPLAVGTEFCTDLAHADYSDAYRVSSASLGGAVPESQFAQLFSQFTWHGCTPDLSTYKASASAASYTVTFSVSQTANGPTATLNVVLSFILYGGNWYVDNLMPA